MNSLNAALGSAVQPPEHLDRIEPLYAFVVAVKLLKTLFDGPSKSPWMVTPFIEGRLSGIQKDLVLDGDAAFLARAELTNNHALAAALHQLTEVINEINRDAMDLAEQSRPSKR
jgi:hypothetical protein